jgi:hypothetical protein
MIDNSCSSNHWANTPLSPQQSDVASVSESDDRHGGSILGLDCMFAISETIKSVSSRPFPILGDIAEMLVKVSQSEAWIWQAWQRWPIGLRRYLLHHHGQAFWHKLIIYDVTRRHRSKPIACCFETKREAEENVCALSDRLDHLRSTIFLGEILDPSWFWFHRDKSTLQSSTSRVDFHERVDFGPCLTKLLWCFKFQTRPTLPEATFFLVDPSKNSVWSSQWPVSSASEDLFVSHQASSYQSKQSPRVDSSVSNQLNAATTLVWWSRPCEPWCETLGTVEALTRVPRRSGHLIVWMVKQLRGVWPQVYKMPSCQTNSTSSLIIKPSIHSSLLSSSLIYLSASLYWIQGHITLIQFLLFIFYRFQKCTRRSFS